MKLKKVFQKLTGMELLMDSECDLLLESMPKTEEECATYSIVITNTLLEVARKDGMDLNTMLLWMHRACEDEQYRAMHLYLTMNYLSLGLTPPPFFLEFALKEALLEQLMKAMLKDTAEYVLLHPKKEVAHV